jgi:CTP synthase (UTP-ammonia lyase)
MKTRRIALVGDYSDKVVAHRAIPLALELARGSAEADVSWDWVGTGSVKDAARDLASYSGVWLVPASPYENLEGALGAVRWARESGKPFLGTCGGFQHALLEVARDVAGLHNAGHEEDHPESGELVLTRLSCSLAGETGTVHFAKGSLLHSAYGRDSATEAYHCNYGLNPAYREMLEGAGIVFTCWDDAGSVRGAEFPRHPFFAGVLFQPERAALAGAIPPPVAAFLKAVMGSS